MLGDLQNPKWMYLKAALFLFLGTFSAMLIVLDRPTVKTGLLVALVAWSFSRTYYFAFYVIEKYVDPKFRFDGIISVVRFCLRADGSSEEPNEPAEQSSV